MAANSVKQDSWSSQAYSKAASYVPQLTTKVLQYLDPQTGDVILDIGCGDGILTERIAALSGKVVGLDGSSSFIDTARATVVAKQPNTSFHLLDCRRLDEANIASTGIQPGSFDKVFSNAAMHWILRDESTRVLFFSDVFRLLKPSGSFVFEQGGFGNVNEIHATIIAVLHLQFSVSMAKLAELDPWFFPSAEWMRQTLEDAGFEVEAVELENRPTKSTPRSADGSGGLEGWIRLMGAEFLKALDTEKDVSEAVTSICRILEPILTRPEDGNQYLGYVRLRAIARKKA